MMAVVSVRQLDSSSYCKFCIYAYAVTLSHCYLVNLNVCFQGRWDASCSGKRAWKNPCFLNMLLFLMQSIHLLLLFVVFRQVIEFQIRAKMTTTMGHAVSLQSPCFCTSWQLSCFLETPSILWRSLLLHRPACPTCLSSQPVPKGCGELNEDKWCCE